MADTPERPTREQVMEILGGLAEAASTLQQGAAAENPNGHLDFYFDANRILLQREIAAQDAENVDVPATIATFPEVMNQNVSLTDHNWTIQGLRDRLFLLAGVYEEFANGIEVPEYDEAVDDTPAEQILLNRLLGQVRALNALVQRLDTDGTKDLANIANLANTILLYPRSNR